MRVIFLDFDGVLNTERYLRERDPRTQSILDETRLSLLRRIVGEIDKATALNRLHYDDRLAVLLADLEAKP